MDNIEKRTEKFFKFLKNTYGLYKNKDKEQYHYNNVPGKCRYPEEHYDVFMQHLTQNILPDKYKFEDYIVLKHLDIIQTKYFLDKKGTVYNIYYRKNDEQTILIDSSSKNHFLAMFMDEIMNEYEDINKYPIDVTDSLLHNLSFCDQLGVSEDYSSDQREFYEFIVTNNDINYKKETYDKYLNGTAGLFSTNILQKYTNSGGRGGVRRTALTNSSHVDNFYFSTYRNLETILDDILKKKDSPIDVPEPALIYIRSILTLLKIFTGQTKVKYNDCAIVQFGDCGTYTKFADLYKSICPNESIPDFGNLYKKLNELNKKYIDLIKYACEKDENRLKKKISLDIDIIMKDNINKDIVDILKAELKKITEGTDRNSFKDLSHLKEPYIYPGLLQKKYYE